MFRKFIDRLCGLVYNEREPVPEVKQEADVQKAEGGQIMNNVFDVALYILDKQGETSTWKLQKLCYYAQAWSLAWTAKPLFQEDFQAWVNGPVCPELFQAFKGEFSVNSSQCQKGDPSKLSEDERDTVNVVLRSYGDKEPYWLREQTHSEKPWKEARGNLKENESCSVVIRKETMGEYYGGL